MQILLNIKNRIWILKNGIDNSVLVGGGVGWLGLICLRWRRIVCFRKKEAGGGKPKAVK